EAGGDMYGEQLNTGTTPAESTADLTFKVPPDSLDTVLDRLAGLGDEVSRHASTEDVTEQVADVDSRVSSAKASLARIRALYAPAPDGGGDPGPGAGAGPGGARLGAAGARAARPDPPTPRGNDHPPPAREGRPAGLRRYLRNAAAGRLLVRVDPRL